ncbi:hypothetical protein LCI18_006148 [Fusarium solani-melongenae]|uniref:Uncharacterized protein n=1 Tax=Fusarium solani subsp. cucurbitae TaxID=2747967 RepID=A0ACD3Z1T3_FUSSC|nr:hypothetical protein LCI18_006148 [Fusarium solani-melongenae]
MHSLEADGPELQALDAIRRLVVPLVEKRITGGTENAKSLAIRNSLDLLRFEMSSLLFWITKGHQLNDEDHGAFLQDLQPVLQLLEELIDPQIVGRGEAEASNSTEQRRYPRLHAIIQKASQDSTRQNDTKPDLSGTISLPESEGPARAAYETVTKFNANNQRRDHGVHTQPSHAQTDHTFSEFDVENTCIQQSKLYASMFKAWAHHFSVSSCHTHRGKLQACALELNDLVPQDTAKNNMFISPCDPKNRWQEVTCAAACDL